jgi:hypothetical protein
MQMARLLWVARRLRPRRMGRPRMGRMGRMGRRAV